MDVLQLIKEDHDRIRNLGKQCQQAKKIDDLRAAFHAFESAIRLEFHIEEHHLYPEIHDLFARADVFTKTSIAKHRVVKSQLTKIGTALGKSVSASARQGLVDQIEAVLVQLEDHFALEESVLMPEIRRRISTQEREDMGYVYLDAREEGLPAPAKAASPAKPKGPAPKAGTRKRA